jgi:hypothetical protein
MKNKKIILLMLVTLLFSGCSVKYNLYINDDLSVNEKITASENSKSLRTNTGETPKTAANSLFELYKIDGVNYSFSIVEKETNTTGMASTSFKSLEEYEDYFKSDIIKEVNISKKDSYITLDFKQDVALSEYASRSLIYDDIEVNIEIPFKVTENNADSIDGNTYTWNITKDGKLKDIKVTFNTNETRNSRIIDLGFFKINVKYSIALAVGIVLILLVIALIVYINNKKNNRF